MSTLLPYLIATGGSIALSLTLQSMGKQKVSNFVGLWAPTIVALGTLHKVAQIEQQLSGSNYQQQRRAA